MYEQSRKLTPLASSPKFSHSIVFSERPLLVNTVKESGNGDDSSHHCYSNLHHLLKSKRKSGIISQLRCCILDLR